MIMIYIIFVDFFASFNFWPYFKKANARINPCIKIVIYIFKYMKIVIINIINNISACNWM